ncbi:uncharacterized protein LOC127796400 isoform X3 [Diospyros lotus]|uniref:uncharacterized protein LOC127796400 isoform X3 n=1 Tax=Diospyros lotus TaxID=55363 RepID=UPI002256C619|nr:uncharacterized protein LOC127796400 isoform X3 [Diospyros lotus]XP_052184493.1 uncharacterized protein LOC127796400 isoform X3 [Diospyros lotus]XP_052184494.1 uncharacterized protein LOC127796400 isoform X3 [Diospyros lotus]
MQKIIAGKRLPSKANKFIAPGALAKGQVHGLKQLKPRRDINGATDLLRGGSSGASSGELTSHRLFVHFGELHYIDNDFQQDCSSFIDILSICGKFLDIYSVGVKIFYGDGKQLNGDADVYAMFNDHKGISDIHVYVEEDKELDVVPYRLPYDYASPEPPKATNLNIQGDLKVNNKIIITGTVIGGAEVASVVQWYKTSTTQLDIQDGLEEISMSSTEKEFLLPVGVVGNYIVAKYTPMTYDGKSGEPVFAILEKVVESEINTQNKKVRGKNQNKKVAGLKSGEKLPIIFYNNRAVGVNHQFWSRHLGRVVRDRTICPVRVKAWKEIGENEKNHMWEAIKEKFENPDIELYRDHTLEHMNVLWSNWRSSLNTMYVKPCKTVAEALKNKPQSMDKEDWEWLLIKHFLTEDFQKISSQASQNKAKSSMPHRTGSKPHREIIYEMRGKKGNPPDMGKIFFETRKKNGKLVEPEAEEKYDQILETIQADPTISNIEENVQS